MYGGVSEITTLKSPKLELKADAQLLSYVARGDQDAFSILVDRHSARLYRIASRILPNSHDAEDAVQIAFSKLWERAPNWKDVGSGVSGWLSRITVNYAIDQCRKAIRLRNVYSGQENFTLQTDIAESEPSADEQLEVRQLSILVRSAMMDLSARHRTAIILSYYEGMSNSQSAEIMGVTLKALESLLVRARHNLRKSLRRRGISDISEVPSL